MYVENGKKETYSQNKKETGDILETHKEEIGLGKFDTRMA